MLSNSVWLGVSICDARAGGVGRCGGGGGGGDVQVAVEVAGERGVSGNYSMLIAPASIARIYSYVTAARDELLAAFVFKRLLDGKTPHVVQLFQIMSASPNLEELIMCMRNANNPREQRVAAIQQMAW
jgi:hypothetical protein